MKFGILYNTDYYPDVHGSASQYYSHILEQVQLEEELGFDSVWFGEHHYSGYSFGSPPVIAMAAAARTKRIRLGTGVSLIPLNHPIRLAEEYAMLDVLSNGRLEYGIGRGFLKYSHQVFGINEEENHQRYHEGTDIIVKAWTSPGPFSYNGQFWKLHDYTFFPKPLQQPYPPIYASGVLTPESCAWAGAQGFHLATAFFVPAEERVQKNIQLYRRALQEAGHNPAERDVAGVFQMYCGESNEEAHRNGGSYVLNYYKFFGGLDQRSPHTSKAFASYEGGVSKVFAGITYEALDKRNLILIGDAENLVARIKWAQEFYGTNYLILEVAQGGMPHKHVMPSLERFAKYVMPHFRERKM
jgi:alkanesulfonate monooxygenase SsuD/methylene tetrahydromethanopterin reductase-like flavin-dependent oxidoreductase (luciferase family)